MQSDQKPQANPQKQFVAELKAAREYRHISLKEISSETMVSIRYLQNLETGEWHEIPLPYLRGYLINYAEAVGMNLERVLKSFDELNWKSDNQSRSQSIQDNSGPLVRAPGGGSDPQLVPPLIALIPLRKKITIALLALALLLLAAWLVWLFGHKDDPNRGNGVNFQRTIESTRVEDAQDRLLLKNMEPRELRLKLLKSGSLRIASADSTFFEGDWIADSTLSVESTAELTLQVERAEDLELSYDGQDLELKDHRGAMIIQLSARGIRVRKPGE